VERRHGAGAVDEDVLMVVVGFGALLLMCALAFVV
jgi:hypothetical protein